MTGPETDNKTCKSLALISNEPTDG